MKALITLMLILLIGALALAKETSNGFEMENVEMGHILDNCPMVLSVLTKIKQQTRQLFRQESHSEYQK